MFVHQNRTRHELELDDFQVRTPTDTIGSHIHLVKFDVLASDGSGNGWNYEDGTFACAAILERLAAASRGRLLRHDGTEVPSGELDALVERLRREARYQSTFQRRWTDPTLRARYFQQPSWLRWCDALEPGQRERNCRDATLRTVFTHDHFGPSSIQPHGFYSALLVEPSGSNWFTPDGRRLRDDPLVGAVGGGQENCLPPATRLNSIAFASTAQAYIQVAVGPDGESDRNEHYSHREFPVAIADFAVLYDPNGPRPAADLRRGSGAGGPGPRPVPARPQRRSALAPGGVARVPRHPRGPARPAGSDHREPPRPLRGQDRAPLGCAAPVRVWVFAFADNSSGIWFPVRPAPL